MSLRVIIAVFLAVGIPFAGYASPLGAKFPYKTVGDRPLSLYVLNPPTASVTPRPAVVLFHGGGWTKGSPGDFDDQCEILSALGLICIQVEYRLLAKETSCSPVICIEDAKSSIRWIKSHAAELGVDPSRIAACGSSAGGQLAAFLALMNGLDSPSDDLTISTRPQALILFNPVLDNGPAGYGYTRTGSRFREFSPYHNVTPGAPPTLILAGESDRVASLPMLLDFQKQMQAHRNRCEVIVYPGQAHGFYRRRESDGRYFRETLVEIKKFLASLGWLSNSTATSP